MHVDFHKWLCSDMYCMQIVRFFWLVFTRVSVVRAYLSFSETSSGRFIWNISPGDISNAIACVTSRLHLYQESKSVMFNTFVEAYLVVCSQSLVFTYHGTLDVLLCGSVLLLVSFCLTVCDFSRFSLCWWLLQSLSSTIVVVYVYQWLSSLVIVNICHCCYCHDLLFTVQMIVVTGVVYQQLVCSVICEWGLCIFILAVRFPIFWVRFLSCIQWALLVSSV